MLSPRLARSVVEHASLSRTHKNERKEQVAAWMAFVRYRTASRRAMTGIQVGMAGKVDYYRSITDLQDETSQAKTGYPFTCTFVTFKLCSSER